MCKRALRQRQYLNLLDKRTCQRHQMRMHVVRKASDRQQYGAHSSYEQLPAASNDHSILNAPGAGPLNARARNKVTFGSLRGVRSAAVTLASAAGGIALLALVVVSAALEATLRGTAGTTRTLEPQNAQVPRMAAPVAS